MCLSGVYVSVVMIESRLFHQVKWNKHYVKMVCMRNVCRNFVIA